MRLWILLIAISAAGLVAFVPSAGAIDNCPQPQLAAAGTNLGCDPGGGGEDPGTLDVYVTTSPVATVGSPMWDDENLTYTVQVSNMNGLDDADDVQLTSEITSGSATFVSSSTEPGQLHASTRATSAPSRPTRWPRSHLWCIRALER